MTSSVHYTYSVYRARRVYNSKMYNLYMYKTTQS